MFEKIIKIIIKKKPTYFKNSLIIIKNNLFAYTGETKFIAGNRFPIPSGDCSSDVRRLSSDFKSRLARFRQINSS